MASEFLKRKVEEEKKRQSQAVTAAPSVQSGTSSFLQKKVAEEQERKKQMQNAPAAAKQPVNKPASEKASAGTDPQQTADKRPVTVNRPSSINRYMSTDRRNTLHQAAMEEAKAQEAEQARQAEAKAQAKLDSAKRVQAQRSGLNQRQALPAEKDTEESATLAHRTAGLRGPNDPEQAARNEAVRLAEDQALRDAYRETYGEEAPEKSVWNQIKLASAANLSGLTKAGQGLINTADFVVNLIPRTLEDTGLLENATDNPVSNAMRKLVEMGQRDAETWDREVAKYSAAQGTTAGKIAGFQEQVMQNVPQTVIKLMEFFATGGASAAASLGAPVQGVLPMVQKAVKELAKKPDFWYSFITELGNNYQEALNQGADNDRATVAALTASLANAAIEVGGDTGEGGLETLLQKIGGGQGAMVSWLLSLPEEGMEEVLQGITTRATNAAMFKGDTPLYGQGGVFDKEAAKEEFGSGMAVAAVLGGAQIGANALYNKVGSAIRNKQLGSNTDPVIDQAMQMLQEKMGESNAENVLANTENVLEEQQKPVSQPAGIPQQANAMQDDRMVTREEKGQQEQPAQQESAPAPVPINVMSDNTPIRQQRIAEAKAFERSLGYGEKGMEAFNQIVEESGETPQQVRRFFQTAYETGMTGLPVEKAHIVTDVQRKAYYAGLADANIQAKAAQESAKLARTHQNAGFNLDDTSTDNLPKGMKLAAKPADVTDSQVQIVDNLAKKLGVRVRMVSGDSIQGNAEIHGNEVYISETFNRVQGGQNRSIVFYAAHEIGMHRLMKLAPDEGRAFINAIIQDQNSSRPSTASTVSQIRQEAYAEQDVYLSTAAAMEEISADSIMGLYESDEAFAEAIERVFRGNDEQAKEGARQYKNALDFVIQKLKEFIGRLTGKSKTEAKQALSELEHQRDLYERALKAAMNKTKSAVATKNATQDGDVKVQHSIYPSFAQQILNWDGKSKRVFKLGTTSEALKSIGVRDSEIRLKSGKATDILTNPDHDMDKDALAKIPLVLEYPIAILKSRQVTPDNKKINDGNTSRLVIFGTIEDTKGVPLAVVLELLPTQGGKVLELSVVASAYGKTTHLRGFVQSSDVLYLDPDKKRTNSWLQSVGVQFPSDAINYGPLGIVTYSNGKVNIQGVPFKEISGADYIIAPKEETKSPMQIAMEKARSKQQEEGQPKYSLKPGDEGAKLSSEALELSDANTRYSLRDANAPVEQAITSAKTSIMQIPALFKHKAVVFGKTNIDIGGGRFDLAKNYLAERGTKSMIFDPYNRGAQENSETLAFLQSGKRADTATCANVLNVIAEPAARSNVILEAAKAIKPDGTAYFMVYEGNGTGVGKQTSSGWQNNRMTADYVDEIRRWFRNVETVSATGKPTEKGKLIVAKNPVADLPKAAWEIQPGEAVMYSLKDDASIEEMQAYLDKLNTEYRGLEQQDAQFKEAPEYKALVDAISEARSGKKSLFDKPEALTKALNDYRVWQAESGYTEVIRRMEDMRGEMKTVHGRLDRAKEQAAKDAKVAYRSQYNEEFAKKYATKAAKKFGTTSRFDFAGYLTVNGSLLNFSGGQGYRVHDHREVAEVLDFLPEDHGYSDGMIEFMNLGNIRLQSYGIDIAKAPNAAQKAKLRQFFRSLDGEVSVDFSNENGDNMGSLEYNEGTRAERILNDIDTYFKTGKVPEQSVVAGFHSMYSLKEHNDLLKQNANLKEVNRELRAQFKTTKFAKVDRKALNSFTKQLLKDYSSDVELEDARAALDGLYTYLANGENGESAMWQEAYDRAFEVSKVILESSRTMDDEMFRTYKALRDDLRKDGISIDQRYNHDLVGYESIAEFKLANRGRIKISENGTPIDIYYQALALDYPEFFDADEVVTPADQLLHIEEVLNKLQPMEVNPFSHNMEESATWLANDILERFFELPQAKPTFADKAERKLTRQMIKDQEKLDRLREEKNAKIAELIAENRDKLKDAVTAERMAAGREMGKLKQKYAERAEKAGERKKASILRARIIRHARDMSQKLLRPSDKQHIPENLRGPVAALLDAINMESQYTIDPITGKRQKNGDGDPTKRTAAFDELRKAYKAIIDGDGEDIVVDPAIELMLDDVLAMRDVRLADMTSHQLKQVWDVLRVMEHTVSNAGKLLSQAKYARTVEWADAFVSDTKTRRGKKGTRMEGFRLDLENPYTFFSHYGEAGKEVFRMLRDAQDEQQVMVENVRKQVQEIVDSKTVRNLEKEVHEFTTERGDKLTLTTAQVMEVYLLMKREQAQAHLMQGGIVQPEIESKKIKRGTDAILLTANDLADITGKLDAKQKESANKLQALTSTTLADYGNKASMKAYGYKKFTGTDYWPIKSAREGIHANVENGGNNTRSIKNIGLAKTVMPGANNPLDIGGAFKTFASHAADMTDYAAWLCPMEDANRLFNFQFRDDNGLRTGRTIKGLLDRVGGKGAQDYWHRLMEDIQNGIKTPEDTSMMGTVNKVIGRARGASVGANIRVIIQQPTAIFRAGAVLSPEAMFRGMFIGGGWKTALKHSPIAMRKDMGGFDISSPMQMNEILFDSKTGLQRFNEAMMWGAGRADAVTWGRIWNACESEVMWDRKDLAPRSDAFYEAVNELFTEVVDQSQVVDGVLQRSQAMRSNDALLKQATAFMGEPTMAMNMMLRAYDGLINEQDAKKRGKALKTFGRTAAVLLITNVVNALAQSLVDADRDDEDDEYWKKFWNAFTGITGEEETAWEKATGAVLSGNFGSGLNPLGYIPFAKDILSIFQGYNVTRADADVMGDIINACKIFIGSVSGDGKKTIAYATKNLAQQVGKVFGISATNILRDVWGIARTIALETGNIPLQYEMEKAIYKVSNDGNLSRFVEVLYKAYQTDKDTYQHIYDDLIASGIDAEDIRDKMEKVMKKAENVKSVDDLEQRYLNPQFQSEYDSKMGTIQKNKLWSKASDAQRDKLEDNLYELIIGSKDGEKLQEKIDGGKSVGLDDTEYLLYRLALDMYDQPTENGKMGTFTQDEAEAAIAAIAGLTDKERAYLWQSTNKGWKEDKNPWR